MAPEEKDAPDLSAEGSPALRLGWEVQDMTGGQLVPEAAVAAAAVIKTVRPKVSLAAKRMASLHARRRATADAAFMAAPAAGRDSWVQIGPAAIPNGQAADATVRVLVSGRITDIAIHPSAPSTIYIATARGGVWKTVDGGANWAPLTDNEMSMAMGAMAIAPSDSQTIYTGTGEGNLEFYVRDLPLSSSPDNYLGAGILKSTDGGSSWTQQGLPDLTGAGFFRISVHPTDANVAFAATTKGLYRTTDGGATWVQMTSGLPQLSDNIIGACDVAIHPANADIAFAAFFADGLYRTANASAAQPAWTKITAGVPAATRRIVIAVAPSQPDRVYALFTSGEDFRALAMSTDGTAGATWTTTSLDVNIGRQSSYNLDLNVDPTTPDVLYISALSLYKVTNDNGTWTAADIGQHLHSDHHCLAFDPANHLTLYAGCDGGIYKSEDGGATWSDSINRGMTITQFEFIDQHPSSDAIVFGGTQDNGTAAYRNSEVFYHADEGDGSYVAIDPATPANVLHGFFGAALGRSTVGGDFGQWDWSIGTRIGLRSLFYPPFALDATNPMNITFGGKGIALDDAQGKNGWKTQIMLPGLGLDMVSALEFVSSTLIYAGTTGGKVYLLTKSGNVWTPTLISAAPLPPLWIWDVVVDPADSNTVYLAFSGFGTPHVFRGVVTGTTAAWTAASGAAASALPDAPIYAIAIRPGPPKTFYAGTDVGVYSSADPATSWELFSAGLPNSAVYDLQYHEPSNLLRAATHGRGLWERQIDPPPSAADADVYMRASIMSSGRNVPAVAGSPAAFNDAARHITLGTPVWWWQSADIKVDTPEYQLNAADVNDVAFETALVHRQPQRGKVNRVYVQVHNRGVAAANVSVKLLASSTLGAGVSNGTPIGTAQTASLAPGRSAILEWDWTPDVENAALLAVCDSDDDPRAATSMSPASEKRVSLLALRVVESAANLPAAVDWTPLSFSGNVRIQATNVKDFKVVVPDPQGQPLAPDLRADMAKALGDSVSAIANASVVTGTDAVLPIAAPVTIFAGIGRPDQGRATVSFIAEQGGCTIIVEK